MTASSSRWPHVRMGPSTGEFYVNGGLTEPMKIEKNDMVMVYDGGGTVPHCKYTGRFGDLTAYWQGIVSDAVYLFRLGESEECDWLVLLGQPWSPYSTDGIC